MTIEATGLTEAQRRLEGMAARLRDLTPVTSVAAADTMALIDDSFAQSKSPDGTAWAPLSDATLMARARDAAGPSRVTNSTIGPLREGQSRTRTRRWTRRRSEAAASAVFNAKPLIDTGRLRSSMFSRGERDGLKFGTNTGYAAPHQTGSIKVANRPAMRAFLPVTKAGGTWALMTAGPGGAHWTRVRESIRRYVATGEVT